MATMGQRVRINDKFFQTNKTSKRYQHTRDGVVVSVLGGGRVRVLRDGLKNPQTWSLSYLDVTEAR